MKNEQDPEKWNGNVWGHCTSKFGWVFTSRSSPSTFKWEVKHPSAWGACNGLPWGTCLVRHCWFPSGSMPPPVFASRPINGLKFTKPQLKEIKPVNPKKKKKNQSWIFTVRTDAEAQPPILRPPDAKSWLTGKDSDVGNIEVGGEGGDGGRDGWMASPTQWTWVWADSRSWWWTRKSGVVNGVACKESDTTERLNNNELIIWLHWVLVEAQGILDLH